MSTKSLAIVVSLLALLGCYSPASSLAAQSDYLSAQQVQEHIRTMVKNLRDPTRNFESLNKSSFSEREQATLRLLEMKVKPVGALQELAKKSSSPEVRYRVARVLRHARSDERADSQLQHVLVYFAKHRIHGMADEILELINTSGDRLRAELQEALCITIGENDFELLAKWLSRGNQEVKIACLLGLSKLERKELGETEAAIEAIQGSLERQPANGNYRYYLAQSLCEKARYREGFEHFEKVINSFQSETKLQANKMFTLWLAVVPHDDLRDAKRAIRIGESLRKGNHETENKLVLKAVMWAYLNSGDFQKAAELLKELKKISSDDYSTTEEALANKRQVYVEADELRLLPLPSSDEDPKTKEE